MKTVDLWHHDYHKIINHLSQINQKWLEFRKRSFNKAEMIIMNNKKRINRTKSLAFAGELIKEYM